MNIQNGRIFLVVKYVSKMAAARLFRSVFKPSVMRSRTMAASSEPHLKQTWTQYFLRYVSMCEEECVGS